MRHKLHFVFYANATPQIGAGHIMRLLALAQFCLQQNISVTFACQQCPEYLQQRLLKEGFSYQHLPIDFGLSMLLTLNIDVLLIDDYDISDSQWQVFVQSKAFLVSIDDNISQHRLLGDLIVNPSSTATKKDYRTRTKTAALCLGPSYTMLRQEFAQQDFIELEARSHILLTLGGADVKNMSLALANALIERVPTVDISILLGGLNNSAYAELAALSQQHQNLHIVQQLEHVAPLMMRAGLAITAAGGTLAELASMGTPSIALVSADNQQAVLRSTEQNLWYQALDVRTYVPANTQRLAVADAYCRTPTQGANAALIEKICTQANNLWLDLCKRKHMSKQARQFIDTLGCKRIINHILSSLSLR